MSDFENIILQGVNDYGERLIQTLTEQLMLAGKEASGRLINSLSFDVRPVGEALYQVILTSEDYLKWVDRGRRPGTYPPIRAIKQWTRIRGIDEGAAYAIQKSIFRFGIEPTNVISRTAEIMNNETDEIENAYKEYVSSTIISRIKNR